MIKHTLIILSALLLSVFGSYGQNAGNPLIEVTGSATINIVPDRITLEIGMEEYSRKKAFGDGSTIVKLSDIEKSVRKTLHEAGVPDSLIVVSDVGNYRNKDLSDTFLMAKRISATVFDYSQIDRISEKLDRKGITSFNIVKIDNSDISRYNRQGLKAALDAAREKAEFIAESENLKIIMPYEIVETTNEPAHYSAFSNVAFDGGTGMENMRRIVRRYTVKVSYLFTHK